MLDLRGAGSERTKCQKRAEAAWLYLDEIDGSVSWCSEHA